MRPTHLARLAALASGGLLVAACSGGGGSSPAVSPAASTDAGKSAAPTRIEVTLSDALKIEPASMTVPAGVPVTFVVTNTGAVVHEFVIGDEEVQAEHETEMEGSMSMADDEENAIDVEPGDTKELVFTFDEAGETLAGCHVVGHYAAGMKAEITIE